MSLNAGGIRAPRRTPDTLEEAIPRFWSRADQSEVDGCWPWLGTKTQGYGIFWFQRRTIKAHRFSAMIERGSPVGPDLVVLHSCDNPSCVNPAHLTVGTQRDNVRDMLAKGRSGSQRKTHCSNGHEYTPEQTILDRRGSRRCRVCQTNRPRGKNTERVKEGEDA